MRAEAAALASLADRLDPSFNRAVDLITACPSSGGSVLVSGLGKSGLIGAKISATLASLGIPSHSVHPAEAVHGDLGRFRSSDVCLAISFSGETNEVVNLAALLRQDDLPVIAIVSGGRSGPSSLERLATVTLALGPIEEAGAFAPAPTTSTTATLALGDALALAAARRMNFTNRDFAKRHPGGSLGGLLRPVSEVLRFRVGTNLDPLPDDLTVSEALCRAEHATRRPGALLLVDRGSGVLTGIYTDADLRRLVIRDRSLLDRPVRELMTHTPGTLRDDALVTDAVRMVREFRRDEIPVVDALGRPVGLLDVQDLVALKVVEG
ncbi:MAG: SIS domain-containing protein [Phycisphaerae bacterium]|nr:SIS domain-containing protein [Phycisphaerae bacterium]